MPHILLATDIFGKTEAVEMFSERLSAVCGRVWILDPYNEKRILFHDENEAYEAFNRVCGLENYAHICRKALDALSHEEIFLIGFSMGASALWKMLDGRKGGKIKHFYGFYASQIRHFLDVNLHVPCTLIFPDFELHFDVDALMSNLATKEMLTCIKTAYLHGFMNPLSVNYNATGYVEYCRWIEESINSSPPSTSYKS